MTSGTVSAPETEGKVCTGCSQWKSMPEFHYKDKAASKRNPKCKTCAAAEWKAYYRTRRGAGPVEPVVSKVCFRCKVLKPAAEFGLNSIARSGLSSWCKECNRGRSKYRGRNVKYGKPTDWYESEFAARNGACDICGEAKISLCVDHDHSCCPSGRSCGSCVRGLLCAPCNKGIGHLSDNPALLRAAADYLEREGGQ